MKEKFDQKKYINEYNKNNYGLIRVNYRKSTRFGEIVSRVASARHESVSSFVIEAIYEKIEREGFNTSEILKQIEEENKIVKLVSMNRKEREDFKDMVKEKCWVANPHAPSIGYFWDFDRAEVEDHVFMSYINSCDSWDESEIIIALLDKLCWKYKVDTNNHESLEQTFEALCKAMHVEP